MRRAKLCWTEDDYDGEVVGEHDPEVLAGRGGEAPAAAAKASKHQDTLSDLVDAWVEPTPTYSFEVLPVEGTERVVIELIVNTGQALFGSSKPNEPGRVYVRHHSRSVPARVREIEEIVQSRSAAGNFHYPRM